MRYRLTTALVVLCAASQVGAIQTAGSFASDAMQARPVALPQATIAPDRMALLQPGRSVTYTSEDDGYNCPEKHAFFTETSAYRWNGYQLSGQRWNADHTVTYWRDNRHGGRVTFDGITFRNHTHRPVLVAGWCG